MKKTIIFIILFFASVLNAEYLGSWNIDDYVTITATMHRFSSGAAYAATGDVDIWIYEDDTAVQIVDQTMSAFDSITGLYLYKVQCTAAAGFEAGKHYTVLIQATVDGVAAITTHNFQILADVNVINVAGTAQTANDNGADINAILLDTGTDGVVVAAGSKSGYSLAADQSGVTIGTVTTLTGHTAQTGDNYARIGAPAGASIAADIAAVKTDTAAILLDTATIDTQAELRTLLYGSDTAGATAAAQTTAQNDLDIITGAAGVVIADNSITAAKLASDCITSDEVHSNALDAVVLSDKAAGKPAEPGSMSITDLMSYMYAWLFNTTNTTSAEHRILKRDESTIMFEYDISDDGTTFTRGEAGAED